MKTKLCIGIFLLATALLRAQTNDLTALLQQGLFEEQANRNLDAAINDYQSLAGQFDKDRQLAATAVFRLGECYRAQGRTNEAAAQYQRVLRDFSDQQTLATLSRQDLAAMGTSSTGPSLGTQHEATSVAISDEDQEIARVQQMIQNSPDLINAPNDVASCTPLTRAAYSGWLKVAAYLLDHGADINIASPDCRLNSELTYRGPVSPLLASVSAGNKAMTQFLIDHGANVGFGLKNGDTPLHLAARKGFLAVVEVLLASHADVNAQNDEGITPLFAAVYGGQVKMIQMLLAAGANVNLTNHEGQTVLNYATKTTSYAFKAMPEIVQTLLSAKADPNTQDSDGRTPLSYATERDLQVVKLLLAAKADPNLGTLDAPLLCATYKNDAATAESLLRAGANPDAKGRTDYEVTINGARYPGNASPPVTPLHLAVSMNHLSMVQLLLKYKADPNDLQTGGQSVLFSALDKPDIVKALLNAEADAGATNSIEQNRNRFVGGPIYHETLLQAAANQNLGETVELLLQHGANPDVCNEGGNSALHYATFNLSDEKVFASLLDHKANPNVRNHDGQTPLDIIKQAERSGSWGRFNSHDVIQAQADKLVPLLHQRGALDNLPNWDRITIGRPGANFSMAVFYGNSNNWNHFTLLDAIFQINQSGNASSLNFPDFAHIVISRPVADGATARRLIINLLDATNEIDFARDVPLQFGDVIEIPEREHTLAETPMFLGQQWQALHDHFRDIAGHARLIVAGGQTVQVPLEPFHSPIGYTLQLGAARAALTSNSDLSRVKVTRRNPKANKTDEWILDCSNQNNQGTPDFWLRAGDIIEVPEKP